MRDTQCAGTPARRLRVCTDNIRTPGARFFASVQLMNLTVQLFASLRERAGRAQLALSALPAELDVRALKRELAARHPELGDLSSVRAVLGTDYVRDDTRLTDGATVALLPPVSGGAPDRDADLARGVFELVAHTLDVALAQQRVAHASCGALACFV